MIYNSASYRPLVGQIVQEDITPQIETHCLIDAPFLIPSGRKGTLRKDSTLAQLNISSEKKCNDCDGMSNFLYTIIFRGKVWKVRVGFVVSADFIITVPGELFSSHEYSLMSNCTQASKWPNEISCVR
eukprot:450166-Pyramimonas_sp.AAC.2